MARRSSTLNDLVYLAAVGGVLYAGYRLALRGDLGRDLQRGAQDLRGFIDTQRYGQIATTLRDLGGQPVDYDLARGTLVQRPPGRNVYGIGDVFRNDDGTEWQLVEPGVVREMSTGQTLGVKAFALAV